MAKSKTPPHKVVMTEGKSELIKAYVFSIRHPVSAGYSGSAERPSWRNHRKMMEVEMENHLGYEKSRRSDNDDYRNGYRSKTIKSSIGEVKIEVPQDRKSSFEPQVVKKGRKDISGIAHKIISMYAKGMTTRQISDTIEDIYGFNVSEGFISDVTDKILPQIEEWQNRPLDDVYPVIYIDAIHYFSRRQRSDCQKAAYVILGLTCGGCKEVLSLAIGENESAKFWLNALNLMRLRTVECRML